MELNPRIPFDADLVEVVSYIKSELRDVCVLNSDVILLIIFLVIQFEAR